MSGQPIVTRTEILFLYDITDANPNGDPNDENRPRVDPETGHAKVTDVRLKRTIRDYLHDYCGEEIFCREIEKEDGTIQEGKDRAQDFFKAKANSVIEKRNIIQQKVIEECIDVRLFGGTIPVSKTKQNEKDSSVTLTGPVQFAMGTSLHRVEPRFIKGTGAFASGQGKEQRTFREEYVLPYALIGFYGIVNQKAAETTDLTAADVEKLFEGIWYGTKNLITRSKMGQRPLFLLLVDYKNESANSYIGRLDRFLDVKRGKNGGVVLQSDHSNNGTEIRDEELREVGQIEVDLTRLEKALSKRKEKIARIRFVWDDRLKLSHPPTPKDQEWTFLGISGQQLEYA